MRSVRGRDAVQCIHAGPSSDKPTRKNDVCGNAATGRDLDDAFEAAKGRSRSRTRTAPADLKSPRTGRLYVTESATGSVLVADIGAPDQGEM
jgi:hypothetical protein